MTEYIERKLATANSREYDLGGGYDNTECAVPVSILNSIPAAEVRPVSPACWIRIDHKPCGHDYECISCGWKNDMKTRFCPNCGAYMRTR